jgi:hypothetical protein
MPELARASGHRPIYIHVEDSAGDFLVWRSYHCPVVIHSSKNHGKGAF